MDKKSYTAEELLNMEVDTPMEYSYRRGYAIGYGAALFDFYRLLNMGASKKRAHDRCWEFWSAELVKWASDDFSRTVPPPYLKANK